jgi:hypothetical protein
VLQGAAEVIILFQAIRGSAIMRRARAMQRRQLLAKQAKIVFA